MGFSRRLDVAWWDGCLEFGAYRHQISRRNACALALLVGHFSSQARGHQLHAVCFCIGLDR